MTYFVYILECKDKTLYTGIATDVTRRVAEHNDSSKSAKYTRARRPVKLRYQEQAVNRSVAQRREAAVKRLPRAGKLALIRSGKV